MSIEIYFFNSLSPDEWVNKIPKNDFVYIVSGTEDDNTYPEFAKRYFSALQQQKIDAHFISVPDGTHNSVVTSNAIEFNHAIENALSQYH